MNRRPWRRCPSCGGICHWHDTDWVCDNCGDEWGEQSDPKFAAPGDYARGGGALTPWERGQIVAALDLLEGRYDDLAHDDVHENRAAWADDRDAVHALARRIEHMG